MRGRIPPRHLLAGARRHLAQALPGRCHEPGLDGRIVAAAIREHCIDVTPRPRSGQRARPPEHFTYTARWSPQTLGAGRTTPQRGMLRKAPQYDRMAEATSRRTARKNGPSQRPCARPSASSCSSGVGTHAPAPVRRQQRGGVAAQSFGERGRRPALSNDAGPRTARPEPSPVGEQGPVGSADGTGDRVVLVEGGERLRSPAGWRCPRPAWQSPRWTTHRSGALTAGRCSMEQAGVRPGRSVGSSL
ncbi:hypothetical protein [Actinacidiphila oryziradicis]|uniref:Uncharacterized protein n=1 Tax=Actinacidiphila oryziradicis TaxID=2571141 RepID=A0A4V5MXE6_9ACTN|nr:hypothetical protein [Actinacidiphila oryziradicis]TJZ99898.1 hypothetical protein FCI23_44160 [Actinacidiphila oryziradicis]